MELYVTSSELIHINEMRHEEAEVYIKAKCSEDPLSAVKQITVLRAFADSELEYEAYSRMLRVIFGDYVD